jgi:hypothetical protein
MCVLEVACFQQNVKCTFIASIGFGQFIVALAYTVLLTFTNIYQATIHQTLLTLNVKKALTAWLHTALSHCLISYSHTHTYITLSHEYNTAEILRTFLVK